MRQLGTILTLSALASCQVASGAPLQVLDSSVEPNASEVVDVDADLPKTVGRRVLVVGDSEACAVSTYINLKRTVAAINDAAGMPRDSVEVDCKGGTTVQYWGEQGHLRESLSRHSKPDAVVVFLGTNHYWQTTTPPTQTVTDLLLDTSCVWVGNTAFKGRKWKINSLIRDAVTPQCRYFDTEAANIPLADEAHPTPSGATKWVKLVWPLIPPKYEQTDE